MKPPFNNIDKGHAVLAVGFATILLLMALLTNHAMDRVDTLNISLHRVVEEYNHKASLLKTMHRTARERIFTMHHMLLINDPFEHDEDVITINDYAAQFSYAREQLIALELSPYEKQTLDIQGQLARQAVARQKVAIANIIDGNTVEAQQQLLNEVIPTMHRVLATLSQLEAVQAKAIEKTVVQAKQQQLEARHNFILMGSAASILGVMIFLFSLFLARRLSHQAMHDPLTGITNRRGFELALQQLLRRNDDEEKGYLCLLDLDHFKQVNDSGGHAAGDALLKEIVATISNIIRRDDHFARMGGDEFALILRHCPLKNAQRITATIRDAIHTNHFAWEGKSYQVGVSIGIVSLGDGEHSTNEFLTMADDACYAAKEGGRNQIHYYSEGENGIRIEELA